MRTGEHVARATLVEYAPPSPVIHDLAKAVGCDGAWVRDQIISAGERIARTLSLKSTPVSITGGNVRVAGVAGLMRVGPRLEIEIAPKFLGTEWADWREDFFFVAMLSRHGQVLANERLGAKCGRREDLAALIARAMIVMFADNQRRPLRTYRHTQIDDFVIDGDVDPESIVLPPADGYAQRVVSYDRRNVYNAAILAATQALIPHVADPQTRRQLLRVAEVLAPQSVVRYPQHRRVPSRARRWQPLHDLAIDVIRGFGVAYEGGAVKAPGFILDTWRVWEDLLTFALRLSLGPGSVHAQRSVTLGTRISFRECGKVSSCTACVTPDIAFGRGVGVIIDAKYKGRVWETTNRISEADLYEAMAFATATNKRQVVLLYPAVARGASTSPVGTIRTFEKVTVGEVVVLGMEVEVRGISRLGALRCFADRLAAALRPLFAAELSVA